MDKDIMIESFLINKSKYFRPEQMPMIRDAVRNMSPDKLAVLTTVDFKDPTLLLIISIFGGTLGIDRFMVGDIGLGVLKLLTMGVCGIMSLVDIFLIMGRTRDVNYELFARFAA